jgi:cytochrome c-type biogenesis protein
LHGRIDRIGPLGACVLGIIFALSFCPVSAALFFGSLFSIAAKNDSGIILPSIYGIGTALPVLFFAIVMGISAKVAARAVNRMSVFEIWARRVTAVVFIIAGVYYCVTFLPEVF